MENNEMLQAMRHMMEQLMDEKLSPIQEDISKLANRIDRVETNLSSRMDKIDGRMDKIEGRFNEMDDHMDKIDSRLDRVETLLEHELPKQIKLLAEGHANVLARLPDAKHMEDLTERVTTLEYIAKEHTRDIEKLKQA